MADRVEGRAEFIVIGAGIAGAALARSLAAAGRSVLMVEATSRFKDRNRGEFVYPWGSAEADRLGIYQELAAAGREIALGQFGVDATPIDFTTCTERGLPALGFYHPLMQQRLCASAEAAGVTLLRGARALDISRSQQTLQVQIRRAGREQQLIADFVIIADGRHSALRARTGFKTRRGHRGRMIAGVLVGHSGAPADRMVATRNPHLGFSTTLIPIGGDRARAYFCFEAGHCQPYGGATDFARFCADSYSAFIPRDYYENATVEGPLASFDCTHIWVDHPYHDRVVLLGDAAGCTDPTMGQGLSLAMRDARVLRDALLDHPDLDDAGHAFARQHDRYFAAIHTYIGWMRQLMFSAGEDAERLRDRVLPKWAEEPSRNPQLNLRGPDRDMTEQLRRRFFAED